MELLEWLDLKYEAYLCHVNLLKHEQVNIGKASVNMAEINSLRLVVSDHQMMIDSMDKKMDQLSQIEQILERIEERTGPQRMETERDVEEIQHGLQKLKCDKIVSSIKLKM